MVAVLEKHRIARLQHVFLVIILLLVLPFSVDANELKNPTEEILSLAEDSETYHQSSEEKPSLGTLWEQADDLFFRELKAMLSRVKLLVAMLVLWGMKSCMDFPFSFNRTVTLGCMAPILYLTGEIFTELTTVATDMIEQLSQFVYLIIPTLTGLIANGGRVLSSAKSTYFILGFMNVLVFLIGHLFVPAILLYFVCSVMSAIVEKDYFSALKKVLLSVNKTALPLCIGIFTTLLTVLTTVSKSSDALTLQTAKMALGNCIPFLGSALSDSGEYLIQTVAQIKAQAGLAGIVALCYIFLVPILKILSGILIFKGLSVCAGFLCEDTVTEFYDNAQTALGMLAGVTATVSVIAILGIMILMGL
ncbi:MAG: hypothetical protein J6A61_02255 [Clostridia bacterium]|nr:hypothetical protein [Clostridia bacterium]